VYYGITYLLQTSIGTAWNSYASDRTTTVLPMWERVYYSLRVILEEILLGTEGLVPTVFARGLYLLLLAFCVLVFVLWAVRRRDIVAVLFAGCLAMLLPICIHAAYLYAAVNAVHTIMLHSFVAVLILVVVLAQSVCVCDRIAISRGALRIGREIAALALAALLVTQVYAANQKYLSMHMQYETVYSYYTTLVSRVQSVEGFQETHRIALVGKVSDRKMYRHTFDEDVSVGVGVNGMLQNTYSRKEFLKYYLGLDMPYLSEAETLALAQTEEVLAMPCYPNDGSIRLVGDTIVVKFS